MKRFLVILFPGALLLGQAVVAVAAEPHHSLSFENSTVAVLSVTIPAGEFSLFHQHSRDNVAVRITGGRMRVDQVAAQGTPRQDEPGSVVFNAGRVPYTHRVG